MTKERKEMPNKIELQQQQKEKNILGVCGRGNKLHESD